MPHISHIHQSHKYESITLQPKSIIISHINNDMSHHTFSVRCRFFYDRYRKIINSIIFIAVCIIVILISFLSPSESKSSNNPCFKYTNEDPVSYVSFDCFTKMWSNTCKTSIPNDFDGGWWLKSTPTNRMIPCYSQNKNEVCGAGNFGYLRNNIFRCNLYYKGL